MCRSPSPHAQASRAILSPFPCNGNRRDLSLGKLSSDTNYTNFREMVGRVTPVRAEIVLHPHGGQRTARPTEHSHASPDHASCNFASSPQSSRSRSVSFLG